MPREAQGAAQGSGVDDADNPRDPQTGQGASGDAVPEYERPDFVLSEETLHKLPPANRVLAARMLRMERENAELRASLAQSENYEPDDGGGDAETQAAEQAAAKRQATLDAIFAEFPEDGNERLAPWMKKVVGGLVQENDRLLARLEQAESQSATNRRMDEYAMFKRLHKDDWEDLDKPMAALARKLGVRPQTLEQLEALRDGVLDRRNVGKMQSEVEALRKGGPVPELRSPGIGIQERLRAARPNGKRGMNFRVAAENALLQAFKDSGG